MNIITGLPATTSTMLFTWLGKIHLGTIPKWLQGQNMEILGWGSFFFSIFAAIERFMICSNRLLGDSRLQYQQYYLLARAWSLWHHFESFTCVGTRDSASEAGFVHGDSLFCNQDLLISALAKDQKISRWGEVVINLVGEELAESEPGGGALQVWGLVAPLLHHRLLHLNIRDGVNLMIWFLFWRFTFLGFALTLMQISLGTLMQFGCWINLASGQLRRAAKVKKNIRELNI